MFNWFKKKNQDWQPDSSVVERRGDIVKRTKANDDSEEPITDDDTIELASIKYAILQDENLHCEVEVKIFNESSANCFGKLLVLLEHGEIMGLTLETLQMLNENNTKEIAQFVDQVLTHWQSESNKMIKPVIRPTEVFDKK